MTCFWRVLLTHMSTCLLLISLHNPTKHRNLNVVSSQSRKYIYILQRAALARLLSITPTKHAFGLFPTRSDTSCVTIKSCLARFSSFPHKEIHFDESILWWKSCTRVSHSEFSSWPRSRRLVILWRPSSAGRCRKNACSAGRQAACMPGIQAQASHGNLISCSASCECLVCESLKRLSTGSCVENVAFDQKSWVLVHTCT